jgi:type II secretory pathway component PulK
MNPTRRGIVFVVLLWVIVGLTTVALYFAHSSRLAYLASENAAAGYQAENAVRTAVEHFGYIMETLDAAGEAPDLEAEGYEVADVAIGDARFWFIGWDRNATTAPTTPVFGVIDEAAKLNINTADLEMLQALPGMTSELAAAIVDWRDADDEVTADGAESSDYLTLATPYTAKNSEFESVDEIKLLRGADMAVLYGEDRNMNGVLDPNEDDGDESWPPDNDDGTLDPGIIRFLTVYSREPNTRTDGSDKVNLRGQSARQDLQTLVTERIGGDAFSQIITNAGNNLGRPESVLAFYQASGLSEAQFRLIEDALTVTPGAYRIGAINVCTAPIEVLACLPGVTREKAEEIVSTRAGLDDEQRKSVAWLTTVLDQDTISLVGPHVTAQSWQFGLDIAAVGRNGRGFRRTFVVVDVEDGATEIHRRDRSREGWPFAEDDLATNPEGALARP